jgi:beta-lactamase class A
MLRSFLAAGLTVAIALGPAIAVAQKGDPEYEIFDDPRLEQQHQLDQVAPFEDPAPLWDHIDAELQAEVALALQKLGLAEAARRKQLATVLVDVSRPDQPRVASINGDEMLYAASLPKIAILLGAFEKIAEGKMKLDGETERQLVEMIRVSSNRAATAMMNEVGKDYIARVLLSPRYRLYDPEHNGGLWVGKEYSKAGVWKRDPIHGLSHGATAMQVARFFYMMQTGALVTPEYSAKMKDIMSNPGLYHKFVGALMRVNPAAALFRKSGSWSTFHSDAILVERGRRAYIAVALANNAQGGRWLKNLAVAFDGIIFGKSWLHRLAGAKPKKG